MKKRQWMLLAAACALCAVQARASGLESLYAGAGVGDLRTSGSCVFSSRAALSGAVGYRFGQYFALEAGYRDMALDGLGPDYACLPVGSTLDITQYSLRVNAAYPVTAHLALVAHAGGARSISEIYLPDRPNPCAPGRACAAVVLPASSREVHETGFEWGIGAQWTFSRRVGLRAEYGRHDTDLQDLSTTTLALLVSF